MRKVLFPEWDSLGQKFIVRALQQEGLEVVSFSVPQAEPDTEKRERLAETIVEKIHSDSYEFVFTVNYLPVVAIACKACRMKYVSWVYDSPCVEVYSETVHFDTNYIFIFDKQTCFDLMQKGIQTVYYLPMAADVDYYNEITLTAEAPYQSDISFVGSLYTQPKPVFAPLETAEGYLKGYLDGLVKAQLGIYGCNFLEQVLTPGIILQMQKLCMVPQRVNSSETTAWLYANYYLARKVTAIERTGIIRNLSERFDLKLYSDEATGQFPEVKNQGMVDYYRQAPQVFKGSKINLNITLRSIQSGIPLRAFDIMGCGGFLLSNYQADFLDYFQPGEDFVCYESQEDLMTKAAYYLEHEEERQQIAGNGYAKIKQYHTYRHRVAEMLNIIMV